MACPLPAAPSIIRNMHTGSGGRGRLRGRLGRGGDRPRQRAVSTPVIVQYQVGYSFKGYELNAVEFSPIPTPASLMDTEQPIAATPTDRHAAGIFDKLTSAQQLSAEGATPGKTSGSPTNNVQQPHGRPYCMYSFGDYGFDAVQFYPRRGAINSHTVQREYSPRVIFLTFTLKDLLQQLLLICLLHLTSLID